jgi:hypothetical protein
MNISSVLNAALESGELTTLSVLGGMKSEILHDDERKPSLYFPTKNSNCGQRETIIRKDSPSIEWMQEEDTLGTISSYFLFQQMLQKETVNATNHSNL